jgi:hypothetical protein
MPVIYIDTQDAAQLKKELGYVPKQTCGVKVEVVEPEPEGFKTHTEF